MHAIRQQLRRPVRTLTGILLIALAVAMLCVSIGQAFAAEKTASTMDSRFTTVALLTAKYQQDSQEEDGAINIKMQPPEEIQSWIADTAEDHPEIVKALSYPGLAAAYIPELEPDTYIDHPMQRDTYGTLNYALQPYPAGAPYSTAMLEIQLDEIVGRTQPVLGDVSKMSWMNDVVAYHAVTLRGTVCKVIALQENFPDPTGFAVELTLVLPDEAAFDALDLQPGERYLVYGMDYYDNDWRFRQETELASDRENIVPDAEAKEKTVTLTLKDKNMLENCGTQYAVPMIAHLTGSAEDFLASAEGDIWRAALDRIAVNNHAFPVIGVDDLKYIADIARGNARITQGRDFTQAELKNGEKICIMSQSLAAANGLAVGDTVSMHYYAYDANSPYQRPVRTGIGAINPTAFFYTQATPFADDADAYEIVGLYRIDDAWGQVTEDLYSFTPNTVFAPKSSVPTEMDYGNQAFFFSIVLHNGTMAAFQELVSEAGYDGLVIAYDQGYSAFAEKMLNYQAAAKQAVVVGATLCLIVGMLYLVLYPMRQREELRMMRDLGAGRGKRVAHVLGGALGILLPGSLLGFGAGLLIWNKITEVLTASSDLSLGIRLDVPVLFVVVLLQLVAAVTAVALLAIGMTRERGLSKRK